MPNRFTTWLRKQRDDFSIQKVIAQRDRDSAEYMARHDAEVRRIEETSINAFDTEMSKLAYRNRMESVHVAGNDPLRSRIDASVEAIKVYNRAGRDTGAEAADGNDAQVRENGGSGIGAVLGRLMNGRRSASVRESGQRVAERLQTEARFGMEERKDVERLSMREDEIRRGEMTPEQVLSSSSPQYIPEDAIPSDVRRDAMSFFQSFYVNDDPQSGRIRFGQAAAEKMKEIEQANVRQHAEFFGSVPNGDYNAFFTNEAHSRKHGLATLENRDPTRLSLARMYMLSQGYTVEQIHSDSPEMQAARRTCGDQLIQKLTDQSEGSMERIGQMLGDMGRALKELPAPDISSDLAIYQNMRDIMFIRGAGIDFDQIVNIRLEKELEFENGSPKLDAEGKVITHPITGGPREFGRAEAAYRANVSEEEHTQIMSATQTGQFLHNSGVIERINFLASPEYAEGGYGKDIDFNNFDGAPTLQGVLCLDNARETFGKFYAAGKPLKESTLNGEQVLYHVTDMRFKISAMPGDEIRKAVNDTMSYSTGDRASMNLAIPIRGPRPLYAPAPGPAPEVAPAVMIGSDTPPDLTTPAAEAQTVTEPTTPTVETPMATTPISLAQAPERTTWVRGVVPNSRQQTAPAQSQKVEVSLSEMDSKQSKSSETTEKAEPSKSEEAKKESTVSKPAKEDVSSEFVRATPQKEQKKPEVKASKQEEPKKTKTSTTQM